MAPHLKQAGSFTQEDTLAGVPESRAPQAWVSSASWWLMRTLHILSLSP